MARRIDQDPVTSFRNFLRTVSRPENSIDKRAGALWKVMVVIGILGFLHLYPERPVTIDTALNALNYQPSTLESSISPMSEARVISLLKIVLSEHQHLPSDLYITLSPNRVYAYNSHQPMSHTPANAVSLKISPEGFFITYFDAMDTELAISQGEAEKYVQYLRTTASWDVALATSQLVTHLPDVQYHCMSAHQAEVTSDGISPQNQNHTLILLNLLDPHENVELAYKPNEKPAVVIPNRGWMSSLGQLSQKDVIATIETICELTFNGK
ncbi:MAG TPA: hypothetical protein VD999_01735 [Vitreimonas sp.]|nr:hypothetical protein [Vitreimonas sp.]